MQLVIASNIRVVVTASQAPPGAAERNYINSSSKDTRTVQRWFRSNGYQSFSQVHTRTPEGCLCSDLGLGVLSYCLGFALRLCVPVLIFLLRPHQRTPCPGPHLAYLAWWHDESFDRPVVERVLALGEYPQLAIPKLEYQQNTRS